MTPEYLFLWNPTEDPFSFQNYAEVQRAAKAGKPYKTPWKCPTRLPQIGDVAFMQRTGPTNNGIFAVGTVTRAPYINSKGKRSVELQLNSFLPLGSEISRKEIIAAGNYQKNWAPMASGIAIPPQLTVALQKLWNGRTTSTGTDVPRIGPKKSQPPPSASSELEEPTYTTKDYVTAFQQFQIAPHHLRMLQANFHAPNRDITANQMVKALGYDSYRAANLHYGKLARQVGSGLGSKHRPKQFLAFLVDFQYRDGEWHWILRQEVVQALTHLGLLEEDYSTLPEEVPEAAEFREGAVREIKVNAYERSAAAREKCIRHYGCRCAVCGLMLAEQYGEAAQGLIHVHHLCELASISAQYKVHPVEDLRPVCPTCHAVIHNRKPAFTIEEVQRMIANEAKRRKKYPLTAPSTSSP